jgi:hypothetical protein
MEHTHSTNGDAFSNEVKVDLYMLGALVLYRVGGEVNGADVVAVDEAGRVEGVVQFLEKLLQPGNFSNTIGDSTVFSLGARPGNGVLSLGRPGNEAASKKDSVAGGGAASVWAAGPVSVRVHNKLSRG